MRNGSLMAPSTCLLLFVFCVSQGVQAENGNGTFVKEPNDVDLTSSDSIDLKCIFSEPVRYCRWFKNDWPVREFSDPVVRFVGSAKNGTCTLRIERPEVGRHTTKWRCAAVTMQGKQRYARDAWIFVKNIPRTDYYDHSTEFEMFYVNITGPNTTDFTMELKTEFNTRIRWFLDGKPVPAATQIFADLVDPICHRVYSVIHLDFPKPDVPIRSVYCVVEFQRNFYYYKYTKVFSAAAVAPWYNISELQANNLTFEDDTPKTQPRPMLMMDGKPLPKDEDIWIESYYPTLHEFRVKCVETSAFPFSVLTWNAFQDESECVSDYSEFNETWQALADCEQIDLHSLLRSQVSSASVTCIAKNIFRMDASKVSVTKNFKLKIVKPTCKPKPKPEKNSASSSMSRMLVSNMVVVVLCMLALCRL